METETGGIIGQNLDQARPIGRCRILDPEIEIVARRNVIFRLRPVIGRREIEALIRIRKLVLQGGDQDTLGLLASGKQDLPMSGTVVQRRRPRDRKVLAQQLERRHAKPVAERMVGGIGQLGAGELKFGGGAQAFARHLTDAIGGKLPMHRVPRLNRDRLR